MSEKIEFRLYKYCDFKLDEILQYLMPKTNIFNNILYDRNCCYIVDGPNMKQSYLKKFNVLRTARFAQNYKIQEHFMEHSNKHITIENNVYCRIDYLQALNTITVNLDINFDDFFKKYDQTKMDIYINKEVGFKPGIYFKFSKIDDLKKFIQENKITCQFDSAVYTMDDFFEKCKTFLSNNKNIILIKIAKKMKGINNDTANEFKDHDYN